LQSFKVQSILTAACCLNQGINSFPDITLAYSQKFWLGDGDQNGKILWRCFGDFFGYAVIITSLKWRHNCFFKVRLHHDQFEKPQFDQITKLQVTSIEVKEGWVRRTPSACRFL